MPALWPLLPPLLPGAACRGMDVSLFVPEVENRRTVEVAMKTCGSCPEVDACRSFAVPLPGLRGVWGATTSRDRERLRNLGGGAAMSEPVLDDVDEPSPDELGALEAELAEEGPVEVPVPQPGPPCVVCGQLLEPERVAKKPVTCAKQSCQTEHRRERERQSKARLAARSNGHAQPEAVPAVAAAPVAVAVSADAYPGDGLDAHAGNGKAEDPQVPLEAVSVWLRTLPAPVRGVVLDGWQIVRSA